MSKEKFARGGTQIIKGCSGGILVIDLASGKVSKEQLEEERKPIL